jgi:hypothetical protein
LELSGGVARLESFVQRWADEVKSETIEGRDVCQQQIEKMQDEEARYVKANESPAANPAFAKVRADLAFAKERLHEQYGRGTAAVEFVQRWMRLQEKLPERPPLEEPRNGRGVKRRRNWFSWS